MSYKKFLLFNLLTFILMPVVFAQGSNESVVKYLFNLAKEILTWVLQFFFGEEAFLESNVALIKAGFWLITFAVLFWTILKANIVENKAAAAIIAAVIALLGVKFMPNSWVLSLATVFRFIVLWVVIIIVAPYLFVTRIIKTPGWFRRIVLAAVYVAIFFSITQLSYVEFGNEILDQIFSYLASYSLLSIVISVAALVVILLWVVNRLRRITPEEFKARAAEKLQKEELAFRRRTGR